jgi:hypothetical protein
MVEARECTLTDKGDHSVHSSTIRVVSSVDTSFDNNNVTFATTCCRDHSWSFVLYFKSGLWVLACFRETVIVMLSRGRLAVVIKAS